MARDGSGVYTQPFPNVVADTTIESAVYNGFTNDVTNDLNAPRPILAGGTGANNATDALINLGAEKAGQIVTNYDSMVWTAGSFYSASTATNPPVAGHAFRGVVYLVDANNITVQARDADDTTVPGRMYVREKKAGVWSAWKSDLPPAEAAAQLADMYAGIATYNFGGTSYPAFIVNTKYDKSGTTIFSVFQLNPTTQAVDVPADVINCRFLQVAASANVGSINLGSNGAHGIYFNGSEYSIPNAPVTIGEPTLSYHAATKGYADSHLLLMQNRIDELQDMVVALQARLAVPA